MKKFLFFNLFCLTFFTALSSFSQEAVEQLQDNLQNQKKPVVIEGKKEFNPKPASASIYNLGLKSYENGDLESAASFFKQAIELDPNFVDAYYNLGVIYKKQKDFPLAIHSFQKAHEIDSQDFEVAYELANCYLAQNDYENAKKYFSLIPADFSKYSQAKQSLEKLNTYISLDNADTTKKNEIINSPQFQGQLLVDTLTNTKTIDASEKADTVPDKPILQEEDSTTAQINSAKAKVLAKDLNAKENLVSEMKIVKDDFSGPTGIAKDSQNNIYVANFKNDTIERITSEGKREIFFTKGGVKGPVGLAVDGSDNLYVANYNGNSILKITPDKTVSILKDNVEKPYYLYYDAFANKLFVTIQGKDALVEINTSPIKQPITSK